MCCQCSDTVGRVLGAYLTCQIINSSSLPQVTMEKLAGWTKAKTKNYFWKRILDNICIELKFSLSASCSCAHHAHNTCGHVQTFQHECLLFFLQFFQVYRHRNIQNLQSLAITICVVLLHFVSECDITIYIYIVVIPSTNACNHIQLWS